MIGAQVFIIHNLSLIFVRHGYYKVQIGQRQIMSSFPLEEFFENFFLINSPVRLYSKSFFRLGLSVPT